MQSSQVAVGAAQSAAVPSADTYADDNEQSTNGQANGIPVS